MLEQHGHACVYCDKPITAHTRWHVDHLTPRSLGGTDEPANLVPACAACNLAKGNGVGYTCHICGGYAWAEPSASRHRRICSRRVGAA